jgi:hypothetical protein
VNVKLVSACAIGVAMIAIGFGACGGEPAPSVAPKDSKATANTPRAWGRAIVSGGKAQLKAYDEKLRQVLGFSNLEEHEVGCVRGCDKFESPDPITEIQYDFPRDNEQLFAKFSRAWDDVQRSSNLPNVKLEFSAETTTNVCDGPNDPPPCSYMPFCTSDQCGRTVSGKPNCGAC